MKKNTKNRILEVGAEIIHLKGFNHAGIQEILDAAGVPKGSFYNYFKSKEDFGLQVIDYFVNHFTLLTSDTIGDRSLSPLARSGRRLSSLRHSSNPKTMHMAVQSEISLRKWGI
jgi:TetR/AcrR family transcriptional repressor of nem operon